MPRFFADDSYWNMPIPPAARSDSRSPELVELLEKMRPEGFWVNCDIFTFPRGSSVAVHPATAAVHGQRSSFLPSGGQAA